MTRQEAAELMGCLWIKLCETETIYSLHDRQIGQGSNFQDLTIGGVTRDGEDATNELSFMVLEVTRQLKVNQPPIYIRVHECMNEDILIKAVETNRDHGAGMPAFMNDAPTLTKLMSRDVPLEDAREWICGGCIIPMVPSGSTSDPGFMFNRVKAFEMVLYNGVDQRTGKLLGVQTGDPREFKSYDELYQAYLTQLEYIAGIVRKTWHITQQLRSELFYMPFGSLTIDDCIERGKGILQGGMRFPGLKGDYADVGHQNAADSLTAIKTLVFDEKKLTMDELLEALKTNFEGHEDVQRLLLSAPKYGNDNDVADDIFNIVSLDASRIMAAPDLDGRPMHIARGGASQHYWAGNTVGALPDGRLAWQPTADANLSPVQGADVNGPTAVLLSATKANHQTYAMTTLLNLKVMPSMVKSKDGIDKLLSLNDAYFKRGGWHVQYNMIDPSVLAAAKKDPQKHRDLVVRVAGYSAYFVDLTPKVQNEIIARTEHSI
jgi:formate C-acetyltransferase